MTAHSSGTRSRVFRWLIFILKIPVLVKFGFGALEWKMLVNFMDIWNILQHSGNILWPIFVYILCIFPRFGTL
jgi:hypothetical protein